MTPLYVLNLSGSLSSYVFVQGLYDMYDMFFVLMSLKYPFYVVFSPLTELRVIFTLLDLIC